MRIENAPYVRKPLWVAMNMLYKTVQKECCVYYLQSKCHTTEYKHSDSDNVTIVSTFGPFLDRLAQILTTQIKAYTRIDGNADASAASAAGDALPQ
ncbi:hypothetical protein [Ruminococcus sp.]|uniref:hypothetical protein n=1 Tax=Ruminococcus sp. TaxID=41978 RepID=UPI00399FC515